MLSRVSPWQGLRLSTPTANPVWYAPVSWSWPVSPLPSSPRWPLASTALRRQSSTALGEDAGPLAVEAARRPLLPLPCCVGGPTEASAALRNARSERGSCEIRGWRWCAQVTSGTTASPISYFESQMGYTFWDRDGSIVGGTGGYLVANNPDILPPTSQTTCTFLPNSNAYACPNSCYRTLQITYYEDGFSTPRNGGMNRSRGDWRWALL